MSDILQILWIIPILPLLAAAGILFTKSSARRLAGGLAIGAMTASFILSCFAFGETLGGEASRQVLNFDWFDLGETSLQLGFVLDPLTASMLVMVTFVSLMVFIFSVGYMAKDPEFSKFFCYLSFFAAAMLGIIISNSLLLLFICWELVGLASYLLIGFWHRKPEAGAAAKKAFITTRVGDIGLFLGMIWLYAETGTLMFYDDGAGCLEPNALGLLIGQTTLIGMSVSTAIALLIFCGAAGKSGQVPLHVWLPDAMEGPTPVSALIHAATMVAAGVFLIARVFPLMDADIANQAGISTALTVVTWVGGITAVFAALIAVAQNDIKRILAYSTVSQLGYMMMGLGVGGVAVGMFHLITHAFFKALLFLGAGSVIHGCHEEQDIRKMGGLRLRMRITFLTYAIGMMALAGVPLFSGFWSKDEILHAAEFWPVSKIPFLLGLFGALLTAFYMTRQIACVFFGEYRGDPDQSPHESPRVMTVPLGLLAVGALVLGFIGTPAWPWFQGYLTGSEVEFHFSKLIGSHFLTLVAISTLIVAAGIGLGWWRYGRNPISQSGPELKPLNPYAWLAGRFFIDELYERTILKWNRWLGLLADWLDRRVWHGVVLLITSVTKGFSFTNRFLDESVINRGFDKGCNQFRASGRLALRLQNGQIQNYLRAIGAALIVLVILFVWGVGAS